MKIKNVELWEEYKKNNSEGYGKAIIDFAERWANLMEKEIEKGLLVDEMANRTSHEADTEGITGFMYGAAVQTLSGVWHWGEQLRHWHNLDTQIGNKGEKANKEGKVLNPALLNIAK
jgi:hypothetical protein